MTDILDVIDRATDGLCPCGEPPADGSAYCSDDCRPTHLAADTDPREHGDYATPMRWRPDLVTAADDTGLSLTVGPYSRGRFTAQIFERDGTDMMHLRLDDGHRFVGTDVERGPGDESADSGHEAWVRLERELSDPRHAVPEPPVNPFDRWLAELLPPIESRGAPVASWIVDDPVAHSVDRLLVVDAGASAGLPAAAFVVPPNVVDALRARRLSDVGIDWDVVHSSAGGPGIVTVLDLPRFREQMEQAVRQVRPVVDEFARVAGRFAEQLRAIGLVDEPEPADSMLRAIQARRNRNTGPAERRRAPRRIEPRRAR